MSNSSNPTEMLMSHYLSWFKLKKIIARLLIAKRCLRLWVTRRNTQIQEVSQIEPDSHQVALIVDT